MYGVTKVAGELLCDYYYVKYGVIPWCPFPRIDFYATLLGGGTTDHAVDIYYSAIKEGKYTSFIGSRHINGYDVYARCDRCHYKSS